MIEKYLENFQFYFQREIFFVNLHIAGVDE